jgi:hypothetical protein
MLNSIKKEWDVLEMNIVINTASTLKYNVLSEFDISSTLIDEHLMSL